MGEPSGYNLPQIARSSGIACFPVSETNCIPFTDDRLNKIAVRISLKNGAQKINVLRLIIIHLNSPKTRKRAFRTIEKYLYFSLRAVTFLNSLKNVERLANDKSILEVQFKNWLIDSNYQESTIAETLNTLALMVKEACLLPNTDHLKNDAVKHLCLNYSYHHVEKDPTDTLDTLHPEITHSTSDKELLIGLREAMVWFLNRMANTRNALVRNLPGTASKYLKDLQRNKENPTLPHRHFAQFFARRVGQSVGQPYDGVIRDLVGNLSSMDCGFINELMFCNMNSKTLFQQVYLNNKLYLSSTELSEYFADLAISRIPEHCFNRDNLIPFGETRPTLKHIYSGKIARIKGSHRTDAYFPSLSFLIYPTIDESLAMEWLLASERIQLTGIRHLDIRHSVLWDKEQKRIQFKNIVKHRRKGEQHTFIYHNDALYKVYSSWIQLLANAEKYVEGLQYLSKC